MRVGAGLLHYRFWPGVRMALDALREQSRAPDVVVVVDNGSDDGSDEEIAREYPDLEIVRVRPNRGPIAGMNVILETLLEREVDAVMQLTHDCRMATTCLAGLVGRLEAEDRVGAVGPLIADLDEPERLSIAGGMINERTWDLESVDEPSAVADWSGRSPHAVHWLNGSAILYRTAAVRETGRLHEDYFAYFDEPDYLYRMRRRGWTVECVPDAVAWERAAPISPYLRTRNRLGFVRRAGTSRDVARELVRTGFHIARDGVRHGDAQTEERVRGAMDFLRDRWGPATR
jgi:GT2 family glycosyltransferase